MAEQTHRPLLWILLTGAVIGTAGYIQMRPSTPSSPRLAGAIATTESIAEQPASTGNALPLNRQYGTPPQAPQSGMLPNAATEEKLLADLEQRLRSEPVSPSWAQYNEGQVRNLLSASQLAKDGLAEPLHQDVECRTTLCRIDIATTDETAMEETQVRLLQGISASLSNARLFYQPQPDGTMAVVLYAGAKMP